MTDLAERLARMTVRVTSPDRRVRAELRGRGVAVSFASPDAYADYRDANALAKQIATVLSSAYAAVDQGHRQIVAQYTHLRVDDEPHWDPRRRRLHEARDNLEAQGESLDGKVRITTTALRQWRVHVVPGTLQRMNATRFCAEVNSAIADTKRAYAEALYELKTKHLGQIGEPRRR